MMKFRWLLLLCALVYFPFGNEVNAQGSPKEVKIDTAYLMGIVRELSSKEYAGRLPGSIGYNKAASYTAGLFKKYRISPMIETSYFQYFKVENNEILGPLKLQLINKDDSKIEYTPGKDFVCRGFTGTGIYTTDVVFCGYGISFPKQGFDDYANVDVKGKVVMIFKENPKWKFVIEWPPVYARYKALIAAQYGAKGVMLVSAPKDNKSTQPTGSISIGNIAQHNMETTDIHISNSVANDFLKQKGYTIEQLQNIIDSTKKPFSFPLDTRAYTEVRTNYTKEMPTMNVVGMIQGNDSVLKDEFLIIGAHLDHVGSQGDELYFPGANDNASGVAAVMQMAKLLSENKKYLKRSVIFILFSDEEHGLTGSWYYVNNPIVPLEKTIAMFNLDCVGAGDSIQVGNGKSAPVLWQMAHDIDKRTDNLMVNRTWSGGGSDANPFYDKYIPALYFVSTNGYTHYHLPSDKPETLNRDLFKKITKLAYATAWQILTGDYQKEIVLH